MEISTIFHGRALQYALQLENVKVTIWILLLSFQVRAGSTGVLPFLGIHHNYAAVC